MDVKQAMKSINVLTAASAVSMSELTPFAVLRRLKKGEHLFNDRDRVHHFFFIASGIAALYKLNSASEKKVLFIYGAGAVLNEELTDGKSASVECELLTDSWIVCIERGKFLDVCKCDFGLAKALMDSMSLKVRRLCHQMKNTPNTVLGERRIASKLWKLSRDFGVLCTKGTRINFDLTITYLAYMLGSKRETVSRQLKTLTDRGLVIIDKNTFIIPNRGKLMDYFKGRRGKSPVTSSE